MKTILSILRTMSTNYQNFENYYQLARTELGQGRRPDIKLKSDEYEKIDTALKEVLRKFADQNIDSSSLKTLKMLLCILFYSRPYATNLDNSLCELLNINFEDKNIVVELINTSLKHLVERASSLGTTIPGELYICFEKLLHKNKNLEVYFWCLHAIDLLGPKAVNLFKIAKAKKPSFFKFYKKFYPESLQHLRMLEIKYRKLRLI